jgi:hypothetical protein
VKLSVRTQNYVKGSTEYVESIEGNCFDGSLNSGCVLKGTLRRRTDNARWLDSDGLSSPQPLLVIPINEIQQK